MKTIAPLIACALASSLFGDEGQLSKDEKRVLELTPGVVFIVVSYKIQLALPVKNAEPQISEFNYTATGSGFLYRPDGYVITNGHVVADANVKDKQAQDARNQRILESVVGALERKIGRKLTDADKQFVAGHTRASTPQIRVLLNNKSSYNGEIKLYSDPTGINNGKDVAIVKIDANNLPTVKLGNSDTAHVQEPITVIGYPGAASPVDLPMISMESLVVPTVTNGHISAVKTDYKGTPVLQSDAAITHGNSGGPAFDPNNEAIGIATYGSSGEVAGFNFFVPINTALEFVRQSGAAPQQGQFDKVWTQALDAFSLGKWETARGLLTDVLGIMPNEPDALRLQNIAAQKARDEGPVQRMMENSGWLVWVLGGVVLIAALGLGAWRMASSRKPVVVAPPPASIAAAAPSSTGAPGNYGTIHVTAGSLNGNRFPVTKAGLMIGRDSTKCNVVLSDDTASKEHAWIVPVDRDVVIIDRESANGTYINSTDSPRVNKVVLKNGDRVYIGRKGNTVLTYFSS